MKSKKTSRVVLVLVAMVVALACVCFKGIPVEAVYPVLRARISCCKLMRNEEIVRLRREVAMLTQALQDSERLNLENARLRNALDYIRRVREHWVAAEVLSYGGAAAGNAHTIRVGKGSLDGLKEGAVVVSTEGLVGRVTSITPHTAEVTLVTDPSVQVSCLIETPTVPQTRGILSGGTNERLVLRYLRYGDNIPPRSRVVTSGLGGVFPKGLAVGIWVDGGVVPSVDFEALDDVFVRMTEP